MAKEVGFICLIGPTATGKSALAIELARQFPVEIVSVDAAMVYQNLNIGTAKPTEEDLLAVPHHLINCCSVSEGYSVGAFFRTVKQLIPQILTRGKLPLLVGGSMLYFRAIKEGLAPLPPADEAVRQTLAHELLERGIVALHQELSLIDPIAGARIAQNDWKRIQRGLEVWRLTGKTLSSWLTGREHITEKSINFFLDLPTPILHRRIEQRLEKMVTQGLLTEIQWLFNQVGIDSHLPATQLIGYAQGREYQQGKLTLVELKARILKATHHLVKHQRTWLNRWRQENFWLDSSNPLAQMVENLRSVIPLKN